MASTATQQAPPSSRTAPQAAPRGCHPAPDPARVTGLFSPDTHHTARPAFPEAPGFFAPPAGAPAHGHRHGCAPHAHTTHAVHTHAPTCTPYLHPLPAPLIPARHACPSCLHPMPVVMAQPRNQDPWLRSAASVAASPSKFYPGRVEVLRNAPYLSGVQGQVLTRPDVWNCVLRRYTGRLARVMDQRGDEPVHARPRRARSSLPRFPSCPYKGSRPSCPISDLPGSWALAPLPALPSASASPPWPNAATPTATSCRWTNCASSVRSSAPSRRTTSSR